MLKARRGNVSFGRTAGGASVTRCSSSIPVADTPPGGAVQGPPAEDAP